MQQHLAWTWQANVKTCLLHAFRRPFSLVLAIEMPVQDHGLTVGETVLQTRLQFIYLSVLFARTSCATWAISFLLCRSKSISYRVSIRGVGEVPSIRLSKAVEGVTPFPPSFFEVWSVSLSDFMALFC